MAHTLMSNSNLPSAVTRFMTQAVDMLLDGVPASSKQSPRLEFEPPAKAFWGPTLMARLIPSAGLPNSCWLVEAVLICSPVPNPAGGSDAARLIDRHVIAVSPPGSFTHIVEHTGQINKEEGKNRKKNNRTADPMSAWLG
eukprot:scaffold372013_cov30-Prasinocladus_malaysianus.AAC.1